MRRPRGRRRCSPNGRLFVTQELFRNHGDESFALREAISRRAIALVQAVKFVCNQPRGKGPAPGYDLNTVQCGVSMQRDTGCDRGRLEYGLPREQPRTAYFSATTREAGDDGISKRTRTGAPRPVGQKRQSMGSLRQDAMLGNCATIFLQGGHSRVARAKILAGLPQRRKWWRRGGALIQPEVAGLANATMKVPGRRIIFESTSTASVA